jgi:hypothetical protein
VEAHELERRGRVQALPTMLGCLVQTHSVWCATAVRYCLSAVHLHGMRTSSSPATKASWQIGQGSRASASCRRRFSMGKRVLVTVCTDRRRRIERRLR